MAASAALVVFAGKSVATSAIAFLVNKAFAYLDEYRMAEGINEMKNRILLAVPKIQAVFDVVNPEHIKGHSRALDAWLWQLRDAVEKAEDAVDEVEYYKLEEKAQERKVTDWGSPFDKMKHRAVKRVKNIGILGKTVKGLTHRGTLKRLRKAVEDLDRAAATAMDFFTLAERLKGCTSCSEGPSLNQGRETGSRLTVKEVFGRHEEKKLVIGWLTQTSREDAEIVASNDHVSVVSIVGHGGMGKTTLAQLIRQDDAVKKHFGKVIWVCVSTHFDARKIMESATETKPGAHTLEALQSKLEEKLKSQRFLLILDDVWDDKNIDQWEKLFAPLRTGKNGSKILMTTRMQSVADLAAVALRGQKECLPLQGLKEDETVKLFNHHAFHETQDNYVAFEKIGEQIAKKVRGCPLVTKVIASHLRDKTFQYWNNFLHQRLEHFEGSSDEIINILKLSYYHLPPELQTCFRYCSIFPQDHEFDKARLVEMWMSSGLISGPAVGSQSLLETAEQYLDQLTKKSFFDLRFQKDHLGQIAEKSGHYVMHDLMHDLAKSVSSGECARIVDVPALKMWRTQFDTYVLRISIIFVWKRSRKSPM